MNAPHYASLPASRYGGPARQAQLRWIASFAVVLVLHCSLALSALGWRQPEPQGAPPAAMLIDMVALPAAPLVTPAETPPAQEAREEIPPPSPPPTPEPTPEAETDPHPEPVPELLAEPLPDPLPSPLPEPFPEPLPAPAREPQEPPPKPLAERTVEPETPQAPAADAAAPQAAPLQAPLATAPLPGVAAHLPSDAVPAWHALLLGHLQQHKRYPKQARWRREEGVVYLHFTMDRAGKVLEYRLETSSGSAALDEETLKLLERAQPLPSPPAELAGETLELVVPVQFSLRQR